MDPVYQNDMDHGSQEAMDSGNWSDISFPPTYMFAEIRILYDTVKILHIYRL